MKRILFLASFAAVAFCAPASFNVDVSGTGKPVILIPGLGCSAEVWRETVAHLNHAGYQTHTLTLAGFGGTEWLASPQSSRFLATVREDLAAYIRQKQLDHPAIIGHSLGGFLAIWLAETDPDLPGKVISVDGLPFLAATMNAGITPAEIQKMVDETRQRLANSSEEAFRKNQRESLESMITAPADVEREMKIANTANRGAVTEAMLEMLSTDLRPQLGQIKAPLVVLGSWVAYKNYGMTHDGAMFVYGKQFANAPAAKIVMNDTGKHFLQLDTPDWFYQQVDAVLQGK